MEPTFVCVVPFALLPRLFKLVDEVPFRQTSIRTVRGLS